jgi:hypothetical protein
MFEMVEPRIGAIKREIERILSLVQFEQQGQPLDVDGFRLRNLANWRTGFAHNVFDALGPLSGHCNARCNFCTERCLPFERDSSILSLQEAAARLRYFSPETHTCLFPAARPYMETFLNKNALEIFKKARAANPHELLIITTNGSCLTNDIITQLPDIKPVLIKFSVNSTTPEVRRSLTGLNDSPNTPKMVMDSLKKAEIPFIGSIVAWPERKLSELELTIQDISHYEPYGIRVRLPLVHKYTPVIPKENLDRFWHNIYDCVLSLKSQCFFPIWVEPVQFRRVPVLPIVDGVILNSPAMLAGLRSGDEVVAIEGQPAYSRTDIRHFFKSENLDTFKQMEVKIRRNGDLLNFHLKCSRSEFQKPAYPYDPHLHHPGERFGILVLPDFNLKYINNILRLTRKHKAQKVLLFCSPLTVETVENLIGQIEVYNEFFKERNLWIYILEDTWLKGNTHVTESRFVGDYETAFLKICDKIKERPDLILIPDMFGSSWGIDFHRRSIFELQYRIGVPIELIPWHFIYGRED